MYTAFKGCTNFIFWDEGVRECVWKGSMEKMVFELNLEKCIGFLPGCLKGMVGRDSMRGKK